jgi:hypothetical protein
MDGQRFDDLTRALVANPGRRRLLRRLAGSALAGSLLRLDRGVAGAACPAGQILRRGVGCVCRTTGRPPVNGVCPCRSNAECGTGRACCGGTCIDVSADLANCGACGAVCDLGSGISACCDGVCTQVFNNDEHCGTCDVACDTAASEICFATNCCVEIGGSCSSAEGCCGFLQGFPELGPACCGGVCTDTQRDEANCGACDFVCPPDLTCGGGGAKPGECCKGFGAACSADEECCFFPTGFCCNSACTTNPECCSPPGGTCITADDCCGFLPGFPQLGPACCDGFCRDTQRDEANCGACDFVCSGTGQICGGGGAIPGECCQDRGTACSVDDDCCFSDLCCDNVCTSTFINDEHCGACNNPCGPNDQCRGDVCCGNPGKSCMTDAECCFGCSSGLCADG